MRGALELQVRPQNARFIVRMNSFSYYGYTMQPSGIYILSKITCGLSLLQISWVEFTNKLSLQNRDNSMQSVSTLLNLHPEYYHWFQKNRFATNGKF